MQKERLTMPVQVINGEAMVTTIAIIIGITAMTDEMIMMTGIKMDNISPMLDIKEDTILDR